LAGLLPSAVGEADPVSQTAAATAAANQFVKKKNRRRPDPQLGQDSPRRSAPADQLVYVGEWHSHPAGYAATPSRKDLLQLAELAELPNVNRVPALMAIVNDEGVRVHSASICDVDLPASVVIAKEPAG
jgi:hypothetical protein